MDTMCAFKNTLGTQNNENNKILSKQLNKIIKNKKNIMESKWMNENVFRVDKLLQLGLYIRHTFMLEYII
jgi:hypothetical protein